MNIKSSIKELIGNTPMVRINRMTGAGSAEVLAKLEWYNIGGSVKDRMALNLIEYAEAAGRIDRERTILEATSGNTGISLAMIAATRGYKISIVMPESASIERRKIIKAYGAELILSPGEKGTAGAVELKQKMLRENADSYVDINQFKDPMNILAHYQSTAREILQQTDGRLDMVIMGIGTAGTGIGVSLRIKEHDPKIKIVGVVPKIGVPIQGLRNPKEPFSTELFNSKHFDEIIEIPEDEVPATFKAARDAARKEGLFVGMSSGAVLHIAMKKAKELGPGKTIVVVLPDRGDKYLSTPLFD